MILFTQKLLCWLHFIATTKVIFLNNVVFWHRPYINISKVVRAVVISIKMSYINISHNLQTLPTFFISFFQFKILALSQNQVVIAQWFARQLATGEVLSSNPSEGNNLSISH